MEWIGKYQNLWKKIGIAAAVCLGMKYLAPLVIPFLIAGAIVYWCRPLLEALKRRFRFRPALSMAVLLAAAVCALGAVGILVGRNLHIQVQRLCVYWSYPGRAEELLGRCCDEVSGMLRMDNGAVRAFVEEQAARLGIQTWEQILPGVFGSSWQAARGLSSFLAGLFVTGIATILLAADYEKIREMGQRWSFYEKVSMSLRGISRAVGRYLRAQGLIMGLVMLNCTAGIWLSGAVKSPVLAGVGTGLLDALPVFGTGTVFVPWILILVFWQKRYRAALVLAVTYGICTLIRELLEPRLVGAHLKILPVVVLASVYVGVKVYGVGGIVLGPLSVLVIQELWKRVDIDKKEEMSVTENDISSK